MQRENKLTELVFILDRSGSMAGLEADTIGGFNAMIKQQRKQDGECYVSTVLFDNNTEVLHDRVKLIHIRPMTDTEYTVRGCTALLDALGDAIHHIGNVHKYSRPEDVPAHTMFIITTDGMENASRRYTAERVKQMIKRQKEQYGWEFLFIGANIDAVETAARYGIDRDRAANYNPDRQGTRTVYLCVYDRTSYEFSKRLFSEIYDAIHDGFEEDYAAPSIGGLIPNASIPSASFCHEVADAAPAPKPHAKARCTAEPSLHAYMQSMDKPFAYKLFDWIDARGMTDVECYKKANIDKKTFSKIKCNPQTYKPSKQTAVAFAIALKLNLDETQDLLAAAGLTLSRSFIFDKIIMYFIQKGIYDVFEINEALFEFDQMLLGC